MSKPIRRRELLAGLSGAVLAPTLARAAPAAAVTDSAGRSVPLPARIERVFPAGPPAAIILYTLAPELLVGWPRAPSAKEREFLLPEIGSRPEVGRITGRGNTANLEAVLSQKPDLILDVGSVNATYSSLADRVQQQTGVAYALLDGRFESTATAYRLLGQLLGRQEAADVLARPAEAIVTTITRRIAPIPRGLETGLGGSINVETIELLAQNVAGERSGGLADVSVEQVLLWNPQIIVTIDRDFANAVAGDPAWAAVAAVRSGRVHLSPTLPFGWVDFPPSVNRLIGLWWLAKVLYPELFPEDLRGLTRDFYQRFYHVGLDEKQIDRLLAGRD